jgi:hypothetical protein
MESLVTNSLHASMPPHREGGGARGAEGRRGGMGASIACLATITEAKRMIEREQEREREWIGSSVCG